MTTALDLLFQRRYGNWTGPGYSATVSSPSFVPYSQQMKALQGVDPLDDQGSKVHDLAYEVAQRQFVQNIASGMSGQAAGRMYYQALADADQALLNALPNLSSNSAVGEAARASMTPVFQWQKAQNLAMVELLRDGNSSSAANQLNTTLNRGIFDQLNSIYQRFVDNNFADADEQRTAYQKYAELYNNSGLPGLTGGPIEVKGINEWGIVEVSISGEKSFASDSLKLAKESGTTADTRVLIDATDAAFNQALKGVLGQGFSYFTSPGAWFGYFGPTPVCFVAGTPISMADGSVRAIERIVIGEHVLAFAPETGGEGELRNATVVRTFANPAKVIWRLGEAGVGITPGHVCLDGDDGEMRELWKIAARGGSLVDAQGRRHRVRLRGEMRSDAAPVESLFGFVARQADRAIGASASLTDGTLALASIEQNLPVVWLEDRGEVETVYNLEVEDYHTYIAGGWRVHNDSLWAQNIGESLGSYLGEKLSAAWGVDNMAGRLAIGAVTGRLGRWIGDTIYHVGEGDLSAISNPLRFFNNIGGALISSAVNMGGAALGRALLGAIGLQNDPLANGLASIVGGVLAQRGAIEIVKAISVTPEAGLRFMADWGLFGVKEVTETLMGPSGEMFQITRIDVGSIGGSLASAGAGFLGSFAGGKLAAALFGESPTGSLGASIGGTIGTIIGGFGAVSNFFAVTLGLGVAGGPIGIFIGAFVGAFLGGALGSVLGGSQSSWGETDVVVQNGTLQLGMSRGNGKALQTASQLAGGAAQFESNILGGIGGRLVGAQTLTFGMTESTKTIYGRVGGFQAQGDAGTVLELAAIAHLKTVHIAGGDLLSKQTLRNTDADTRAEMGDDLTIAASYALYVDNTVLFERNLDQLLANRGGAGAWAAQKARAEGQLNLDGAFTAAAYRVDSLAPIWNIGATTALTSIARPTEAPPVPPSLGTATMAFSAPVIALDLNRDGVIAQGVGESGALFDIDGDGFREQTGWLTPFDGFLVFDLNHDGEINSIAEMAVSQSYAGPGGAPMGIVLSSLDSDHDGYFDADDAEFFNARVWTDRNLNGSVDLGELWSLTRFNIDHLSLTGVAASDGENDYRDSAGSQIAWESAYGINGAEAGNFGYMTTLSLAYDTKGVKMVTDPTQPGWVLLEHENGQKTAFGLGTSALNLIGGATFARTLFGGEGNDTLNAPAVASAGGGVPGVFIDGKRGNDIITGSAADDVLTGGKGRDGISGGGGDDVITADDEDVLADITGGVGRDALIYEGSHNLNFDISVQGFEIAIGGSGNDHLWSSVAGVAIGGGAGNDTIQGTSGADRLEGDGGNDTITGGAGDDVLSGGNGVDAIDGGDGDDIIYVDAADFADGVPRVTGGAGSDTLVIEGDAGAAIDLSAANVEGVLGGVGGDLLRAGSGSDAKIMHGGDGDDILVSGIAGDTIMGGEGIDLVSHQDSAQAVQVNLKTGVWSGGTAADDTLDGIEGIIGSQYADALTGDDGDNILEGGASGDTIDGGNGSDTASYRSSDAAVTVDLSGAVIAASGGHATGDTITDIENLIGSAHADTLIGSDLDNVFEGLAGADHIVGGLGSDTASYRSSGAGVSVNLRSLTSSGGDATGDVLEGIENVIGSRFNDVFVASGAYNDIDGGAGIDRVSYAGTTAGVTIDLGLGRGFDNDAAGDFFTGIENAEGGEGDDVLIGGAGANLLMGGDGADFLRGATGDTLMGGWGNDTYSFGQGDGVVIVEEGGGLDTIAFRDDISLQDLVIGTKDGDVFIGLRESAKPYAEPWQLSDRLQIKGGQAGGFESLGGVERLLFATGEEMLLQVIGPYQLRLVGTDGNDLLIGDERNNTLEGGAGDDWLFGAGGNDWLFGGNGNDVLFGGTGNDWLFGEDGDDLLFGEDGDDTLFGGDGNDQLFGGPGNDVLEGGPGNDVLDGGPGNDILNGGTGFDIYVQRAGGGYDRVYDSDGLGRMDFIVDTTFYGVNNTASLYSVFANWTNFIGITPSADTFNGQWYVGSDRHYAGPDYMFGILYSQDQQHNADSAPAAVIWSNINVSRTLYTPGFWIKYGVSNDFYQAALSTNFRSEWDNDRSDPQIPASGIKYNVESMMTRFDIANLVNVRILAGSDTITGTEGGDVLGGEAGDDRLWGYGGADYLNGGSGNDALSGGDGSDFILGDEGNDTIDGGRDGDDIRGGAGSDTITGGSGDDGIGGDTGNDYIDGGSGNDSIGGGTGADRVGASDGADTAAFASGIARDQLWFTHDGNDLVISVIGQGQAVTVADWYTSADNRLAQVTSGDGYTASAAGIEQMVAAMASFSPPASGQTTLPPELASNLSAALTANWQHS